MKTYRTTEEVAASLGIKPATLHQSIYEHGHHYGLKPVKLPSRKLAWPLTNDDYCGTAWHKPGYQIGETLGHFTVLEYLGFGRREGEVKNRHRYRCRCSSCGGETIKCQEQLRRCELIAPMQMCRCKSSRPMPIGPRPARIKVLVSASRLITSWGYDPRASI